MLKITILGGADSVGRSCVMISDKDRRVVLDAGIHLHPRKTGLLSSPPDKIDGHTEDLDSLLISHAHIDHSGYVPALYRAGYEGNVHMTSPTKEIVKILWKDHLKIEGPHHYGISHLHNALHNTIIHEYNKKFQVTNGVMAEFYDASHILGSAGILLDWDGTRIFYTGDFNNTKTPFHDPITFLDPDEPVDILLTETTNASRKIDNRKIVTSNFTKNLLKCYERGGKAIIPSFALGRSQEIQTYLVNSFDSFLYKFPLYIDGMILDMNTVYEKFMDEKWISPRLFLDLKDKGYRSPFNHDGIKTLDDVPYYGKRGEKREKLSLEERQLIILTTSGMLEGGPIYDYLRYGGANPLNGLYIVGYQVEGTLGSDILTGKRKLQLNNGFGEVFNMNLALEVKNFSFSGHSSLEGLIDMVRYSSPSKIYTMHGDSEAQYHFSHYLEKLGINTNIMSPYYDILPEYP